MKKYIATVLLLFATVVTGLAQNSNERTVTGQVIDAESGDPLAGVTVMVQGTTIGTSTDLDGEYDLDVSNEQGNVLAFSFIGYVTEEILLTDQSEINVELELDIQGLDEVVVVGYGQQRAEALTGSVSTIRSTKLEQVPVASFENALQGNVSGVQMVSLSGEPGSNTHIRIRGRGSISASNQPLYVVDGVIVDSGSMGNLNTNGGRSTNVMAGLNPNDIESISVLKDAASTAIYGSRGANGVILITTKSGRSGAPQIDLRTQVGFNSVASNSLHETLNAEEYTQLFLEGYMNQGESLEEAQAKLDSRFSQLTDPATGAPTDTDWLDRITRTGLNQSYDLSVTGGSEDIQYYVSASYFDQESHIIGTYFDRLSTRANLDIKVNDYIDVTNNLSLSRTDQRGMRDGSAWANQMYNAFLLSPLIPIKDEAGNYNAEHKNYFPMGGNNPVGALRGEDDRFVQQFRLIDNLALDVRLLDNFTFRSQWNVDIIQLGESEYKNPRFGDGRNSGGYAQENEILRQTWTGTQTLNYLVDLNNAHHISALAGYEAQKSNRDRTYAYGENFPNPKLKTLSSAASAYSVTSTKTAYSFLSAFGRVNYDFDDKYFFSASLRRDGSSRFGADNRWGTFYSIGGGWAIHGEDFMQDFNSIDNLKLRASYGITGNAEFGSSFDFPNFPALGLYSFGNDYDGIPGGRPTQIANPALTWERQENFNIGLDFGFLTRFSGTVEYFTRVSSDLLLEVPISKTTGFQELTQNFGEMQNTGVEIAFDAFVVNNQNFSWNIGFNTTFLNNKITRLDEDYIDGTKIREEGSDFMSYYLYLWAGVDQTNGMPLWYTDETRSQTTSDINEAERVKSGHSATPDHFGGISTTVAYKQFALDAQFSYSWGNSVYDLNERFINGDGALTPRSTTKYAFENRWLPGKTDAKFPMHMWGGNNNSNVANSTRWLKDGSFFRLRNITLAYSFQDNILSAFGLRSLRAYVRGTNLLTFTRDDELFFDPEQNTSGNANGLSPAIKSMTIGFDIGL